MSVLITSSLDKKDVLQKIIEQVRKLLNCSRASILLVDPEKQVLRFSIFSEPSEEKILCHLAIPPGEGVAGTVWQTGTSRLVQYTDQNPEDPASMAHRVDTLTAHRTVALMATPLNSRNRTIGVMEAVSNDPQRIFDDEDLSFFQQIASLAAIAIENSILYEQAIKDPLTGLFIRRYFEENLQAEMDRSRRYGRDLSVVLFDLDFFKRINDTHGHAIGDRVLRTVGRLLQENCRSSDIPCRFGGEEFIVLLPETDCDRAVVFAERFRRALEIETIETQNTSVQITVSGGISCACGEKIEAYELFRQADEALYRVKANGRNAVFVY